jgi:dipeptidyl-peptidase-4
VYATSPIDFQSKVFVTLEGLNAALNKLNVKNLKDIPTLSFKNQNDFYTTTDNKLIECIKTGNDVSAEIIATLPEGIESSSIDTVKMSMAYVSKNNLFVKYKNDKAIQITTDGSENIVYGKAVHRDEFGIDRGIFWSPKGNYLAFYRMDQSMVEDYPIVNWNETPATVKNIKYPFAGRTSHQVTVGVYDCKTGKILYLNTGEPKDQYLTTVTWSPSEKYIYVSILNRDQNYLKLNRYDIATGELDKTLFEERNDKYVEPQHPIYYPTTHPNQFIWWSQRDGYMHLYQYTNDTLNKQLTSGNWVVNEILGYDANTQEMIFTSSKESPMQKNVYAVNVNTKAMRTVSSTFATHTAQLSRSGNYLIDNFSGKEIPRAIEVVNMHTQQEKRILTAPNTLTDYNTARVQEVHLKANDGTDLIGKLIYPTDFDSTKKYPTIVYLYNGPHVQLNRDVFPFSGNLWYDYMAQHGYVLFVLDGRGSGNRGFQFESVTHRQLGTVEMEDQLKGVDYLKSLSFVDANRMGVHGWSFGGFMTTSLMLRHPGIFKCAVAGGPVMDWSMYEVMYTERYMDTPEQNPEGYKNSALYDKIKNLNGKLLLIHGTDDETVVWEHSIRFVKKAVDEGVQLDYFVYPGHPHNVRGKDREHLMQKITDYFDANLK